MISLKTILILKRHLIFNNQIDSKQDEINKNREQNFENSNNVSDNHKELERLHTMNLKYQSNSDNNKASYNYENNKDAIR